MPPGESCGLVNPKLNPLAAHSTKRECCNAALHSAAMHRAALHSAHTDLSHASLEVIPIMVLPKEMRRRKVNVTTMAEMWCKGFEDNSGPLGMVKVHNCRPRTKHLDVKPNHFCFCVELKEVTIHPFDRSEQLAGCLTKPLPFRTLQCLPEKVMG